MWILKTLSSVVSIFRQRMRNGIWVYIPFSKEIDDFFTQKNMLSIQQDHLLRNESLILVHKHLNEHACKENKGHCTPSSHKIHWISWYYLSLSLTFCISFFVSPFECGWRALFSHLVNEKKYKYSADQQFFTFFSPSSSFIFHLFKFSCCRSKFNKIYA